MMNMGADRAQGMGPDSPAMKRGTAPANGGAGLYTKGLALALQPDQIGRLKQLDQFSVAERNMVFRAVVYHWVGPCSLTMETIYGESAKTILARSGRLLVMRSNRESAARAVALAGRWLGRFHQWPSNGPCEPYDAALREELCLANLRFLREHGLPEACAEDVRQVLKKMRGHKPNERAVTIHGDFKSSNLMLSETETVGIDMEGYHRGHPLIDLGQFVAHLFLARSDFVLGTGSVAWWAHLARRFLTSYRATVEWDLVGLDFRLFEATLEVLAGLIRRHPGLFWRFRGRALMVRAIRQVVRIITEGALYP